MSRPPRSRSRLLAPALVVVVALVLGGCSSAADEAGSDSVDDTTSESTATTAPTTESTTTASTAPPATGPSQPIAFTATARDAINELKAAWEAGDRARALNIAPSDVVDTLFFIAADGWEVYGCDTGEFETSYCNYRRRADETYINIAAQRYPEGWQIVSIDAGD